MRKDEAQAAADAFHEGASFKDVLELIKKSSKKGKYWVKWYCPVHLRNQGILTAFALQLQDLDFDVQLDEGIWGFGDCLCIYWN